MPRDGKYLDLGRAWQMMLAAGLVVWVVLLYRAIAPRLRGHESSELSALFIAAAVTIPVFYVPAFFYDTASNFTVVNLWRFWIIHLWVENFLELFVTCAVAIIFYQLGIVSSTTASRVVYLDALLYLGSGIIGTGHHWYFTGQGEITMAFSAVFSAMEVVPLTLLTLDAWDFVSLTRGLCDICGEDISVPHRWTFYFLMAVGVWRIRRCRCVWLPDQHANRQLLRGRDDAHAESWARGVYGRLRDARGCADGIRLPAGDTRQSTLA